MRHVKVCFFLAIFASLMGSCFPATQLISPEQAKANAIEPIWMKKIIGVEDTEDGEMLNLTFIELGQIDGGKWRGTYTHPKKPGSEKTRRYYIFFDNFNKRGTTNYVCAFSRSSNGEIIFTECDLKFVFKD